MTDDFTFLDPGELVDRDLELVLVRNVPADPVKRYVPGYEFEMRSAPGGAVMGNLRVRVGDAETDLIQDETSQVAPKAAYSSSKFEAERILLGLADDHFCPVILRKGTVFGFSPRMRYDLVVNTFVRAALTTGVLVLHYGGEMWRPLVDVRDAARAYIRCLQAEESLVRGEIYNISHGNHRISELALRVRAALKDVGINVDIRPDYGYRGVRSYRVSTRKVERVLAFRPVVTVEESVQNIVRKIEQYGYADFDNPRYYNIRWMKLLEEAQEITQITGSVFEAPAKLAARETTDQEAQA